MKFTSIEWTDFTSNPIQFRDAAGKAVWACVKHSSGCANCYAEQIATRFHRGQAFTRANMEGLTPFLDEKELKHLLTAKTIGGKPVAGSRCFLGDMTDVFGEWVPDEMLDRLFTVFALRPDVTFQLLTKRPDRMAAYFGRYRKSPMLPSLPTRFLDLPPCDLCPQGGTLIAPLPNVWLGTSVENQAAADERIPHLAETPAAVRFLSCEPLISAVDLTPYLRATDETQRAVGVGAGGHRCVQCGRCGRDLASQGRGHANPATPGRHGPVKEERISQTSVHSERCPVCGRGASDRLDGEELGIHSKGHGSQSHRRREAQQPALELGTADARGKHPAQFPGVGPAREGSERGEELGGEARRSEGTGDPQPVRSEGVAAERDRDSLRGDTANGVGDSPSQDMEARSRINWVIVGGESGPGARPLNPTWVKDIVNQCRDASVACFVKQDSGPKAGQQGRIPLDVWQHKEFPSGN